ncbi:glycosyltransferase family 2 protein [Leptobacterium sp. I13]|uniref:glycosyltransferase family 2 protein n=1 Tax=Leptobacterium meishanense TaxID=3128904 RepID=UPI0030EE3385
MISILIPIYNYNTLPLVQELCSQVNLLGKQYEIICIDDASDKKYNNEKIRNLPHCSYLILKKNIGRSALRNCLSKKAMYDNLLFLDCDVMPVNDTFLEHYVSKLHKEVVYGGCSAIPKKPSVPYVLHWKYGKKREALCLKKRLRIPFKSFSTVNFMIKKTILEDIPFNESLKQYGCEDSLLAATLKSKNISVSHIENPVYHNGIEPAVIFLAKSEKAMENLAQLTSKNMLPENFYRVSNIYRHLNYLRLHKIPELLVKHLKAFFTSNFNSSYPSIFLLDLYKLGYYSKVKKTN